MVWKLRVCQWSYPLSPVKDSRRLSKYWFGGCASYFYLVAHTTWNCMGAIHLSGNMCINCLYAKVSVSWESMIGYTTDLGRVLIWCWSITCYTHAYTKVSHVWVVPSCGDDAVNRTMVRVVNTTCMCIWGYTYVECINFNSAMHSLGLGWNESTAGT
jgi:hypothetical protein